jgi:archaellum biogenesis ATPase FlaH
MMNHFQELWDLGFRRLVPIITPDAEISERSSLLKRKDARGKAVGVRGQDGRWFGFDWLPYTADERDCTRWAAMGAGTGIKMGCGLIGIDADTLSEQHAKAIKGIVEKHCGRLPLRVGQYPKALYLCRVSEPMRYTRVEFGENNERVEILSDGRQAVAYGVHPKTMQPYTWPRPLVPFDDLPIYPAASILHMLEEMRAVLPAAKPLVTEGSDASSEHVNQDALKGDLSLVRKAVAATPNTSEHFPARESYLSFGYAIKAALPDQPDEAFSIFSDWCSRWTDGENDPAIVEADWRRMRPPFRRGANWLYELAETHSGGTFSAAEKWFEQTPDDLGLFPTAVELNPLKALEPIKWVKPSDWSGVTPPAREWEVEGWIPRHQVTLLYGDGGIGKTLLTHQYATAAAAGIDWLGIPTRKAKVMCFFCEDSEDELLRRQVDINRSMGLEFADIDENLRITSRMYLDNLFILWDRNTGAMKRQAVWEQLRADAVNWGAEVIVVDTIADTYGGSEIDRGQVNAFVKSCLGRLAQEIKGSVIALGHPSVAGKQSGSGTSGSTAWSNAARSRLFLRYPKGVEKGNVRELEGMKLNYGPKGSLLKLRWARGVFEVIASSSPAGAAAAELNPFDPAGGSVPGSAAVGHASLDEVVEVAVVEAIAADPVASLSMNAQSKNFAPRALKRAHPHILDTYTAEEVDQALLRLMRKGAVKAGEVGRSSIRKPITGFVLDQDKLSAVVDESDVPSVLD